MTQPLRLLLADDHVLFRKGMTALITARTEMQVVGEASDGLQAVALARETQPDIILLDIHMPRCSGLEAIPQILLHAPNTRIVMLTVSDEDSDLFAAIKAGAMGYLLKDMDPEQLFTLLDRVRGGEAPIAGVMATKILREFRYPKFGRSNGHRSPAPSGECDSGESRSDGSDSVESGSSELGSSETCSVDQLTEREEQVLRLVANGATNREIASALSISENTAKMHLRHILDKLHVQNRIQATAYAVRQGLAETPMPDKSQL